MKTKRYTRFSRTSQEDSLVISQPQQEVCHNIINARTVQRPKSEREVRVEICGEEVCGEVCGIWSSWRAPAVGDGGVESFFEGPTSNYPMLCRPAKPTDRLLQCLHD